MSVKTDTQPQNKVQVRVVALIPVQQFGNIMIDVTVERFDVGEGVENFMNATAETLERVRGAVIAEVLRMDISNTAVDAWLGSQRDELDY